MTDAPQVSKRHHAIVTSLTAGAIAGALAKTTIAPLDRTKINFQVSATKLYSVRSALRFIIESWRNEGPLSLWRGNSATMARVVPFAAIQFTAHEQWKRVLSVDVEGERPTPVRRYAAGSLAGVTATVCTFPLDTARARMAVSPKCEYWSLRDVFVKIWRQEGFLQLYRGLMPTVAGSVPYAGTSFFTYETLKLFYYDQTSSSRMPPYIRLICGAVAGLIGQTASYPLDIVRRRMQTRRTGDLARPSTLRLLWHIGRTEGVRYGLYKGLSMNWIKGPIAVGISFTTFDLVLRYLRLMPYFGGDAATA